MDALARQAWSGVAWFLAALACVLFTPAWTLLFWQAWLYLTIFGASVAAITAYFLRYDRALIERRLQAGPAAEREPAQARFPPRRLRTSTPASAAAAAAPMRPHRSSS